MGPLIQRSTVLPTLRYRNAPAALDWLCEVFGFERHLVVPGEGGTIAHAQLVLGGGMIMLGSATDTEYGRLLQLPDESGGRGSSGLYLIVEDADEVCTRARARGARIEMEIEDQDYGGRGFTCRDPEGHLWSVGTYDPWTEGE